jgi:hypothetical protein
MDQEIIEFAILHGLLTPLAGEVMASDRLLESLSESSRHQINRLESPVISK